MLDRDEGTSFKLILPWIDRISKDTLLAYMLAVQFQLGASKLCLLCLDQSDQHLALYNLSTPLMAHIPDHHNLILLAVGIDTEDCVLLVITLGPRLIWT